MLPSAGYFRGVNCPFFASGLCHRPYCHFKHGKVKGSSASRLADISGTNSLESSATDAAAEDDHSGDTASGDGAGVAADVSAAASVAGASSTKKHTPSSPKKPVAVAEPTATAAAVDCPQPAASTASEASQPSLNLASEAVRAKPSHPFAIESASNNSSSSKQGTVASTPQPTLVVDSGKKTGKDDGAGCNVSSSSSSKETEPLLNVVIVPDISDFATTAISSLLATQSDSAKQTGNDSTADTGASGSASGSIPHYSPPPSPSPPSSPSFSPPPSSSPSPPNEFAANYDSDDIASNSSSKKKGGPRMLLSYQTRPEDFDPADYTGISVGAESTNDAEAAAPLEDDDDGGDNDGDDGALHVADDSLDTPSAYHDIYNEPTSILDLEELLNAYSTTNTTSNASIDTNTSTTSSNYRSHESKPVILSSGLTIIPDHPKSKKKPNKEKKREEQAAPTKYDERDKKYQVQDSMSAEGRNKRRLAHTGAAAVHQPRGRSGTVPLRRRPIVAGMPASAVAGSQEPPANLKPGQGYDNDVYSSIVRKRVAHPSGPADTPSSSSSQESPVSAVSPSASSASSGTAVSSTFYKDQGKKAAAAVRRPMLPLHLGGKIPRNIRQRVLDQFFDLYVAQGMASTEAHDLVMSEESVIFKRATTRQLYNNLTAVKLGRLRTQIQNSSDQGSDGGSAMRSSQNVSEGNGSGMFKKSAHRVAATPSWSTSAQSTTVARDKQPVAAVQSRSANPAGGGDLFASPSPAATSSNAAHRNSVARARTVDNSSSASSGVGAGLGRAKLSISGKSVNPSLAAAMQDLVAVHDKAAVKQSRTGQLHSATGTKRKSRPEDDLLSGLLPSAKKSSLSAGPGRAAALSSMKIPKVKSTASSSVSTASASSSFTSSASSLPRPNVPGRSSTKAAPKVNGLGQRATSSSTAGTKKAAAGNSSKRKASPLPSPTSAMTASATSLVAFSQSGAGARKASKPVQEELTESQFYAFLEQYIATERQLHDNGYPQPTQVPSKAIIPHIEGRRKPHPPQILSAEEVRYFCSRCGTPFVVKRNEVYQTETCTYHFGRAHKHRESGIMVATYSCCSTDAGSTGCQVAKNHVWDGQLPSEMPIGGYVTTKSIPTSNDAVLNNPKCFSLLSAELLCGDRPRVLAFDCEMSYTTIGLSLTRITVIDFNLNVLMDTLVAPRAPVVDYNTRFSGVTDSDLSGVSTRLEDVQEVLLSLIGTDTILIGHSLESDLKAIKVMHNRVVDTSLVFPHKLGPPYKKALKTLAAEKLNRVIQQDDSGHSSAEDAIVAMEIMVQKIKEDIRKSSRKSSTVLVRKTGF
ncbi:mucin-19-like isoform X2 [Sycon ciliatum]|uniref:mucin-19-like isoform X2 n=1 Tax=Sycon ciliatum TaxID=27933 RepID=UPI0031F6AC7D